MKMNNIILFSIFLFIFIIIPYVKKEAFVQLTDGELNASNSPFDSEKAPIYNKILYQYKFYPSVHKEEKYCDIIELYCKTCKLNLSFASK